MCMAALKEMRGNSIIYDKCESKISVEYIFELCKVDNLHFWQSSLLLINIAQSNEL